VQFSTATKEQFSAAVDNSEQTITLDDVDAIVGRFNSANSEANQEG
jgi:hypothetical protein